MYKVLYNKDSLRMVSLITTPICINKLPAILVTDHGPEDNYPDITDSVDISKWEDEDGVTLETIPENSRVYDLGLYSKFLSRASL